MKHTVQMYLIVVACVLPALLLRDYTPSNELRYLSIADEALANGHFFAFTNEGQPYADKPPLFLWILMLGRMLPMVLQRLLYAASTVIPAIVGTEIAARLLPVDDKLKMVFRLMSLTTALMLVSMLTLRMDMLMLMFIMLAIRQFYRCITADKPHESFWLPVFLFLAVFTKGALGIAIPLAIIIVYLAVNHKMSQFFRIIGWRSLLILCLLFGMWFTFTGLEGGSAYLNNLVFHQTIGRAFHSFHHKQPFYYYLYMVWPLLLPWSFLAILGIVRSLRNGVRNNAWKLILTSAITSFVVLSMVSAKLSIYLLPMVPFAIAATLPEISSHSDSRLTKWALAIPYIIFAMVLPAYAVIVFAVPKLHFVSSPWLWLTAIIFTLSATSALWLLHRGDNLPPKLTSRFADNSRGCGMRASVIVMAVGILMATFTTGFSFRYLNPWIGYRALCAKAMNEAKSEKCNNYVAVGLKNASNMSVYLKRSPTAIKSGQPLPKGPAVVMANKKDAGNLGLANVQTSGDYVVGYKP